MFLKKQNLILVLLTIATTSQAWWDKGHLLVGRMAQYMFEEDPSGQGAEILNKIEADLKMFGPFTDAEKNHPLTECATFADIIKDIGLDEQSHWHFIDTPFLDEGYVADILNETYNVTWAIPEMIKSLKLSQDDPKQVNYGFARSLNLRLLVHYIGDVHQPLHATSRYTADFPNGDMGGNLFMLTEFQPHLNELHAVWDSMMGEQKDYVTLPLDDETYDNFTARVEDIMIKWPANYFPDMSMDPRVWAAESYEQSKDYVYVDIEQNTVPSDDYLSNGLVIVEMRLAQAGYRLGVVLDEIYGGEDSTALHYIFKPEAADQGFLQ